MADTLDVVSLTEAKSELNITNSTYDTELAQYITAVSRRLDALCGPVVVRTLTTETKWLGRACSYVDTLYRPISSVSAMTEYDSAGNSTSLTAESVSSKPADGYLIDTTPRLPFRIYRRASGAAATFPAGGAVTITYVAGRAATTAAADAVFKNAANGMLRALWTRRQGLGSETFGAGEDFPGQVLPTFAVPRQVLDLLAEELIPAGVA